MPEERVVHSYDRNCTQTSVGRVFLLLKNVFAACKEQTAVQTTCNPTANRTPHTVVPYFSVGNV